MWPLLRDLLAEVFRLVVALGSERVDHGRAACEQALVRERRRLFEALALLCLGLLLLAIGLLGLILLAWWALPPSGRLPVMGVLMLLLVAAGALLLDRARRRASGS